MSRRRPPAALAPIQPLSAASNRLAVLAHAKLTEQKIGDMLAKAAATIVAGLEATDPVYSPQGVYLGEKPNWNARSRFTSQILDLAGVIQSRNAGPSIGKVQVTVPTPDWAKPAPKSVEAKVIESGE